MDTLYSFVIPETIVIDILDLVSADIRTLHSCLLSNRCLFRATAPYLYADPFRWPEGTQPKTQSLLGVLTACAAEDSAFRPIINYASLVKTIDMLVACSHAVSQNMTMAEIQAGFAFAETLVAALVRCSTGNLERLRWSSYPFIECGVSRMLPNQPELVAACLRQNRRLRVLEFTGDPPLDILALFPSEQSLGTRVPSLFPPPCQNLTTLRLVRLSTVLDPCVIFILRHAQKLEVFEMAATSMGVGDELLDALVPHPLQELYLRGLIMDDCSVDKLTEFSATLRKLKLERCKGLRDDHLVPVLAQCHRLQLLDLSYTTITAAAILPLAHPLSPPHDPAISPLTHLHLTGIPVPTPTLVQLFRAHMNLSVLKLDPVLPPEQGQTAFFESLARSLPFLVELELPRWGANTEDLLAVILRCPYLRVLRFSSTVAGPMGLFHLKANIVRREMEATQLCWPGGRIKKLKWSAWGSVVTLV
ncbi:hypothetical protein BC938DRAFT_483712 [Jimgerdemannia flammicorona]|uniref:F-box domain-containing protein n=1 Tax=Jimgerdemannia flammicorona TaxID=994334 RepID=A0A433QVN5_9FUNG|nr:hypothetical protein BC938DRAFT_483712 [Jimgerdemannia flammicorona]